MNTLNPDAPAFDPSRFASAKSPSVQSKTAASTPSFVPNPDAPAFTPNPDAPAFKPHSSVPLLGGFRRNRDKSVTLSGTPMGGPVDDPRGTPPIVLDGAPTQSRFGGAATPGTPGSYGPTVHRPRAARPPSETEEAMGHSTHFSVNGSDSLPAGPPPPPPLAAPRTWQPPTNSGYGHNQTAPTVSSQGPMSSASHTTSPPAVSPTQPQVCVQVPSPTPPKAMPPMQWVPPHQKMLAKAVKVALPSPNPVAGVVAPPAPGPAPAAAASAPALPTPTGSSLPPSGMVTQPSYHQSQQQQMQQHRFSPPLPGPQQPQQAGMPPQPAVSHPAVPAPAAIPPASVPPPMVKGWVPPHQRKLMARCPLVRPAEMPSAKGPAAGARESAAVSQTESTLVPAATAAPQPPSPPPQSRATPASIPPRISSAPMGKGGAAALRPMPAVVPRKGMPGLPSRPPAGGDIYADPTALVPQNAEETAVQPHPMLPSYPQQRQQPTGAGAMPVAPYEAEPLPPPGKPPTGFSAPLGLGRPPPLPVAPKMWQPPQYGKRASSLTAPPGQPGSAELPGFQHGGPLPPPVPAPAYTADPTEPPAGATPGAARKPIASLLSAPAYTPVIWRPPHTDPRPPVAAAPKARPTPDNPLVVLIYGNRGAGKTTQAEAIAKAYGLLHVSSGQWFREDKKPFAELRAVVRAEFGPGSVRTYNGLVLDRFIVSSDIDAYYVQSALDEAQLPVPLTIWLQVDPSIGMQRAAARGDDKTANEHWRLVEQRAQASTADKVYSPLGVLKCIDVNVINDVEVTNLISAFINTAFPLCGRVLQLPPRGCTSLSASCPLITRHEDFLELSKQVHVAVGNPSGRTDSAPLSSIGGYVDRRYFNFRDKSKRSLMMSSYVTLKVDGTRFLVGKHREFGYVGLPYLFQSCYDMNELFSDLPFGDLSGVEHSKDDRHSHLHSYEALLDCELAEDPAGNESPLLHVIDFVYLYGTWGKKTPFLKRYELLQKWFGKMCDSCPIDQSAHRVVLKEYVPAKQLGTLLPSLDDAPFLIDGIVFQHTGTYRFGIDKCLLKWKSREQCTADFRLQGGRVVTADGLWQFDLYVSDSNDENGIQEVPFPNAVGEFWANEVSALQLRDSMVVELALAAVDDQHGGHHKAAGSARTTWHFRRTRADKPTPNKLVIVKEIVELQHLAYPELLQLCADLEDPVSH